MKPPLISYCLQIMSSEENSVMTADGRQLPKNYVNRKQSMHGQDYHEDVASKQSFFFVIDTVRLWCIPPSPRLYVCQWHFVWMELYFIGPMC